MNAPIFIIGNPRSGTTLLRLMMTCHRNIVIPPECGFAIWWREKYRAWGNGAAVTDELLSAFVSDLVSSKKFETWQLGADEVMATLRARRPSSYPEAVSCVYEAFAHARGRRCTRWGDKNNFYLHHIAELKEMFPTACFVHIIRDGRNVACSYLNLRHSRIESKYAPRLPGDIREIGEEWRNNILIARRGFEAIGWQQVFELRFEDLVLHPEEKLRELCVFLGEDFDPAMLAYNEANRNGELEPKEFLQWKQKTLRPPMPEETTRYLRELKADDRKAFEAVTEEVLQLYAYR